MAVNGPTGVATAVSGIAFDANGVVIPPQRPYTLIEQWERTFTRAWASLDDLNASLATAPPAEGLPEGAPSPNSVYLVDGQLCRYVIDPDIKREPFVHRGDDGGDEVRERVQFRKQYVALTLEGARLATDRRREGEPETDFWCGFTWIRGGYSPERTAPVAVQMQTQGGPKLVFDQPASPTDAARIRHEVATMDRRAPTLPIETTATQPKRGRKPRAADESAGASDAPAED